MNTTKQNKTKIQCISSSINTYSNVQNARIVSKEISLCIKTHDTINHFKQFPIDHHQSYSYSLCKIIPQSKSHLIKINVRILRMVMIIGISRCIQIELLIFFFD